MSRDPDQPGDATSPGVAADAGTLRALEFAAVVEMLAALTAFAPSRELALAAQPMSDAVLVGLQQDQTDEAVQLLHEQAQVSIGGARDLRTLLERARRGGRLTAGELLDIATTLHATGLFGARLRDEVDLANICSEVRLVVAATVEPVTVEVWIRQPDARS